MMITLRKATKQDAERVAGNLRKADALELDAACGRSPQAVLLEALNGDCWVACIDRIPAALFGRDRVSPDTSIIWMVGTDSIAKRAKDLLKLSRMIFKEWHKDSKVLMNRVHADNALHIRYLKHLGCTFGPPLRNARGFYFMEFTHVYT